MRFRAILAACILAASGAGEPTQPPVEAAPVPQDAGTLDIASGVYREVCHALEHGEQRRYSFTSTVPLEFNIHYHLDDTAIDLAVGHHVHREDGLLAAIADGKEIYCWMWVNVQMQPAELTFRIWEDTL